MLQVYLGHTITSEPGSDERLSGNVKCLYCRVEKAVMSRDKDTLHRIIGRVEIWIHLVFV